MVDSQNSRLLVHKFEYKEDYNAYVHMKEESVFISVITEKTRSIVALMKKK